ncbi:MAG: SDR family NAD(P)-dependent oxidoreductase [Cyclobacteriaceae bacterium]
MPNPAIVVITGASSGIGRATALEFAKKGAIIFLLARRKEALDDLAEECIALGATPRVFPLDVTDEEAVRNVAQAAVKEFGRIDMWVNNAAVSLFGRFEELPGKDIRRLLEVNLFGYLYGAQAVLPYFREQGSGILVNVSSIVGIVGQPYTVPYSISKSAIRGLSLSLAQELADTPHIRVCTVYPAVIDTPIFNQAGNLYGKKIQAPKPRIKASKVAKTIVRLLHHPQTEVIVGGQGKMARTARLVAPGIFDKQFRKNIANGHFSEESAEPTLGNLYEPKPQFAQVSGGWKPEDEPNFMLPTLWLGIGAAVMAGLAVGLSIGRNR